MNGYRDESGGSGSQITEVWAHNLEEEFERIRDVVEKYQYVAMDTEFPGIVARPTGNVSDYNYQTVKYNVDLLKVIQLGITFADQNGDLAESTSTWQFNFRFDLNRDMYAQDSIDFLKQSGIDFDKQQKQGIDVQDFGELIMSSGLVMNEDVKWISFHGCYDFGYLLKLLTCAPLPHSEHQFFELLHDFFPALYDIKYLLKNVRNFNFNGGSSLQKVAEQLQVQRVGPQHQAGSDSLVTCGTFFKLMQTYFENQIDDSKFSGIIYGLGMSTLPKHIRIQQQKQQEQNAPLIPIQDSVSELSYSSTNGCDGFVTLSNGGANTRLMACSSRGGASMLHAGLGVIGGTNQLSLGVRSSSQGIIGSHTGALTDQGAVIASTRNMAISCGSTTGSSRGYCMDMMNSQGVCGSGDSRLWIPVSGARSGSGFWGSQQDQESRYGYAFESSTHLHNSSGSVTNPNIMSNPSNPNSSSV